MMMSSSLARLVCRPHLALAVTAAALSLAACGQPTPDQTLADPSTSAAAATATTHTAQADGPAHEVGDDDPHANVSMMADDADLRPLDAPLEITHEAEVEPRAVEDLGPPGAALLVTSSLKGYIEPCGCTLDVLLGGIDRVSGYVRSQRALLPASLVIDTGSMLFEEPTLPEQDVPQAMRKARLLLQGHQAMGTASTTPGLYDLTLGVETYRAMVDEFGLAVTVSNLYDVATDELLGEPWRVVELDGDEGTWPQRVGVIGVVDPATVEPLADRVRATDPIEAVRGAVSAMEAASADAPPQLTVAVVQGEAGFARELARQVEGIDFVLVGYEPRKTDESVAIAALDEAGDEAPRWVLEPYSQGRHVGVLKLYANAGPDDPVAWRNARVGSEEELARLDRRIAYLDSALDKAGPALASAESEFVKKKRAELAELQDQRLAMSSSGVELPEGDANPAFAWFSVAMEPGYPLDLALHERKQRYTEGLEALYAELALEVPEPAPGAPSFVGGEACVDCHEDAHDVWESTPHMLGYKTLVAKGKQFDPDCLVCHVTGYGQPGGSIIGDLDGFEGVQCESCHGPGSIHVADPDGEGPGQVWLEVPASQCITCHDPENSPRFDYDKFLPHVLGEGHEQGSGVR